MNVATSFYDLFNSSISLFEVLRIKKQQFQYQSHWRAILIITFKNNRAMERKLRKLEDLAKMDYKAYKRLLKNHLTDWTKEEKLGFVLVKGDTLMWEEAIAEDKEEQPLLYLGPIEKWERELKDSEELELEDYAYGQAKVVQVGKEFHIYLEPEKGKITDSIRLKPIDKIFRKFRPKIFLEVVGDLEKIQGLDSSLNISEEDDLTTEMVKLGQQLEKYDTEVQQIRDDFEEATSFEKQKLRIQYKQVLNRLKGVYINWKEDILPEAATLIQGNEAAIWMDIYEEWAAFFEKRQAAKEGKSADKNAVKEEEERLYAKALEDIDMLFTRVEKSRHLDPSIIETILNNLTTHVENWKAFIANQESSFQEELKEIEEQLESLNKEWKVYQPHVEKYHLAQEAFEQAQEQKDMLETAENLATMKEVMEDINKL